MKGFNFILSMLSMYLFHMTTIILSYIPSIPVPGLNIFEGLS